MASYWLRMRLDGRVILGPDRRVVLQDQAQDRHEVRLAGAEGAVQVVALARLLALATGDDAIHQPRHLGRDMVGHDVVADVLLQRLLVVEVLDLDDAARNRRWEGRKHREW